MNFATEFLVLILLLIITFSLIDSEENKTPKTQEQAKAIILLEQHEAEKEQKRLDEILKLKDKTWGEVGFTEEAVVKFYAHGYQIWLFIVIFVLGFPVLVSKLMQSFK